MPPPQKIKKIALMVRISVAKSFCEKFAWTKSLNVGIQLDILTVSYIFDYRFDFRDKYIIYERRLDHQITKCFRNL